MNISSLVNESCLTALLLEKVIPSYPIKYSTGVIPFFSQVSFSLDLIARLALVTSGCSRPIPAQKSFKPPPDPVDSITGALKFVFFANLSATIVAKGNTVEEFNKNLKEVVNSQKFGIDFDKCINNKRIEDFVLEDRINGVKKFNVNATPTIIINNKKFDKTLNYKNLKKTIEKLI